MARVQGQPKEPNPNRERHQARGPKNNNVESHSARRNLHAPVLLLPRAWPGKRPRASPALQRSPDVRCAEASTASTLQRDVWRSFAGLRIGTESSVAELGFHHRRVLVLTTPPRQMHSCSGFLGSCVGCMRRD